MYIYKFSIYIQYIHIYTHEIFLREHKDVLPLDFILGFYVTQVLLIQSTVADVVLQKYYQGKFCCFLFGFDFQVVSRWWCQFTSLYWVSWIHCLVL